eukprot:TRINITY_DN71151_c0_g1_i1.p1 TRINITY_DN71151_c0_g1~~TRINITY_DN71151_c0_g1_i1.p1  ORF type:complete len:290 (+),score=71.60 TRINITY_DN71151_c0_g1_i1:78-872(+)
MAMDELGMVGHRLVATRKTGPAMSADHTMGLVTSREAHRMDITNRLQLVQSCADENRILASGPTMIKVDFDAFLDSVAIPFKQPGQDCNKLYRAICGAVCGQDVEQIFYDMATKGKYFVRGVPRGSRASRKQFCKQLEDWGIEFNPLQLDEVLAGLGRGTGEDYSIDIADFREILKRSQASLDFVKSILDKRINKLVPEKKPPELPRPSCIAVRRPGGALDAGSVAPTAKTATRTVTFTETTTGTTSGSGAGRSAPQRSGYRGR